MMHMFISVSPYKNATNSGTHSDIEYLNVSVCLFSFTLLLLPLLRLKAFSQVEDYDGDGNDGNAFSIGWMYWRIPRGRAFKEFIRKGYM